MLQIVYQNELMPPSNRRLIGVWSTAHFTPPTSCSQTRTESELSPDIKNDNVSFAPLMVYNMKREVEGAQTGTLANK